MTSRYPPLPFMATTHTGWYTSCSGVNLNGPSGVCRETASSETLKAPRSAPTSVKPNGAFFAAAASSLTPVKA